MGNAVCPLTQVPTHGQTDFKPRKGKALEHNHIAIGIQDLPIAGGQSACKTRSFSYKGLASSVVHIFVRGWQGELVLW